MFWGFSSSLDLLREVDKTLLEGRKEIHILLVGAADARHILQTMARFYVHNSSIQINYYVIEFILELIARQMLLLTIALEPKEKLGLSEKARLWMELYGNTHLRHTSYKYLMHKSIQLVHMITDIGFLKKRMPLLNVTQLKYAEKDGLENIFKFWSANMFEAAKLWDERVRKSLGVRYDSKEGAFDWDYSMKLKEIPGAQVVNSGEYKKWRRMGVAFSWLETEAHAPNPTLACGILHNNGRLLHMGYMGDIRVGPFFTFGLNCEDEDMMKTYNGIHIKRSTDIFERNLTRIFHEIATQEDYIADSNDNDLNLGVTMLAEDLPERLNLGKIQDINSQTRVEEENENVVIKTQEDYSSLAGPTPGQQIIFLPRTTLATYPHKEEYDSRFQVIFIAQNTLQYVTSDVFKMADDGAIIVFESTKYIIGLTKDDVLSHQTKIEAMVKEANCEPIGNFDPFKNEHALYKIKRQ